MVLIASETPGMNDQYRVKAEKNHVRIVDEQEIQSFDIADVLLKLIGWFIAIPSVMTNKIASYKPQSY